MTDPASQLGAHFARGVLRRLDAIAAAVGAHAVEDGPSEQPARAEQPAEQATANQKPVGRLHLASEVLELLGGLSTALGRPPGDIVRLALGALVRELERGSAHPTGGPLIVTPGAADVAQLALPRGVSR